MSTLAIIDHLNVTRRFTEAATMATERLNDDERNALGTLLSHIEDRLEALHDMLANSSAEASS